MSDTPIQSHYNLANPAFPGISTCTNGSNGPGGDLFVSHMDYVNDDSKLLFSAGQVLRMQAIFGPGGYRESLKSSPGLLPTLGISTQGGPLPTAVNCGDQTDYKFRPTSISVGCGGGYLRWEWAATNGWTMTAPNQIYPQIIPSGNTGSTITLTGTYTNLSGVSFPLDPASVVVVLNPGCPPGSTGTPATPVLRTPVFTSAAAALCSGDSYTATVAPVTGATSYRWTVPPGFTPTGQVPTTAPTLTVFVDAGTAGNFYSLGCQALSSSSLPSATASVPLTVNGGPQYKIVDSDPMQNYQGVVCQRNQISLYLVPVVPVVPGAVNALPTNIQWSSSSPTNPTQQGPLPMEALYYTEDTPNFGFTVTATYTDACGTRSVPAVSYTATTAPAGSASLSNGYTCAPYQWRQAPPALAPSAPYPNPAAGTLHLPGYQGPVVVYNPQGKPVQTLLAPGTAAGASVDTRAWPAGLYVVTGRDLTGAFQRHNVQIQH